MPIFIVTPNSSVSLELVFYACLYIVKSKKSQIGAYTKLYTEGMYVHTYIHVYIHNFLVLVWISACCCAEVRWISE